ncbi:hypothetical protein ASD01_28390 [Ensifer sp. Root423]|nr:hypothetical protein ASD01_28390 [Ensifer sp. Root423]
MAAENGKLAKGVVGGWLLHHDQKLLNSKTVEFENIATAGRSARLLSAISKEDRWTVDNERVVELGRQLGIRKHELPGLLNVLASAALVGEPFVGTVHAEYPEALGAVVGCPYLKTSHTGSDFDDRLRMALQRLQKKHSVFSAHSIARPISIEHDFQERQRIRLPRKLMACDFN